tara:strand:+ start:4116 stop:4643 length:528 start_codon:yes stop_codon:yes gene_type:complete
MAFKFGSTLVGINNKIYLQNKAKKMEQNRKKPKEYYINPLELLSLYIKRNFSEQGRNIGIEYQSCLCEIPFRFLKLLADLMGYRLVEKSEGSGKASILLTGKLWLNDIADKFKSNAHLQLLTHSQADLDYMASREQKDRLNIDQGGVNSRAAAYKNKDDERQEYNPEGYSDDVPF